MNSLFIPSGRLKGQGLVEYAIIIALVAIVVIVVMRFTGPKIGDIYSSINDSLAIGTDAGGGSSEEDGNNGLTAAQFVADLAYGLDPNNGCLPFSYGANPGCDAIYDRVQTCQGGSESPYCAALEDYLEDNPVEIPGLGN
ncbi:MAG: hypothetical protein MHPDNHAH_00533 [Anaerolineales bacterium]|nr:hypothetical protein [Anaerolineales bacterium]WKZ49484.1 MAG: hypothetical protein QY306_08940 [Anaerolineales bacterium]